MLSIGHRGAAGHEPENTLLSIEKALDLGVDFIEIDVYCIEGALLVIHDETLDRTTNGSGYIWDHSLAELRQLDAGKGQQIPLLEEVLEAVNRRAGINIELKGAQTASPTAALINRYIRSGGWRYSDFLVSSFNHHELAAIKKIQPEIPIGALICGIPIDYARFAEALRSYSVNPSLDFINAEFVADAHQRGLKVLVYTVNNRADLQRMSDLGVDGVFSDYPDLVK